MRTKDKYLKLFKKDPLIFNICICDEAEVFVVCILYLTSSHNKDDKIICKNVFNKSKYAVKLVNYYSDKPHIEYRHRAFTCSFSKQI